MRQFSRLALLAGLALAATSGAALAQATGVASISTGPIGTEFEYGGDVDSWAVEAAASGVYQFTPEFGVQGDVVYSFVGTDEDYFGDVSNLDGAVHLFFRDQTSFLIGGFVQLGSTEIDYGYGSSDFTRSYVGVEGQLYLDVLTLYGQLGLQGIDYDGYEDNGIFANVEARYFVTDDFRVDVHAGISTLDEQDYTTYNLGLGAEYKFADLPVSVFGKVDYYNTEYGSGSVDSVRATVGLKFNFGDDSLFDRDRTGPTLKPVEAPLQLFSNVS